MKHLFSSGEVLYKKNERQLPEGLLLGSHLEYDEILPDTEFDCYGTLNGKDVKVSFTVAEEDFDSIKSRHNFRILMQSDIFQANWKSYQISDI